MQNRYTSVRKQTLQYMKRRKCSSPGFFRILQNHKFLVKDIFIESRFTCTFRLSESRSYNKLKISLVHNRDSEIMQPRRLEKQICIRPDNFTCLLPVLFKISISDRCNMKQRSTPNGSLSLDKNSSDGYEMNPP